MRKLLVSILCATALVLPFMAQEPRDSERLGMAIEYFQSGKYHEALLIFEKLDKEYTLNPRYHAFMGVCYYYEWAYEEACRYLDEAIPQLDAYAPHERSVYYYADGESHFQLQQYGEAIPYFERALTVCYENEKGDIYYRIGLCHMFANQWQMAHDNYQKALDNYLTYRDTPDMRARIHQTAHMMKGCEKYLEKTDKDESADSPILMQAEVETLPATNNDSIALTEWATSKLPGITLPTLPLSTEDMAPLKPVDVTQKTTATVSPPTRKDTIRSEIPKTVNLQDLYEQKVEVKE